MSDGASRGRLTPDEERLLNEANEHLLRYTGHMRIVETSADGKVQFHRDAPTPQIRYVWGEQQERYRAPWWLVTEHGGDRYVAWFYDFGLAREFARARAVAGVCLDHYVADEYGLDWRGLVPRGIEN